MPLSKNRIKYIHSLELKKNRKADHVFLAEGPKTVEDLLTYFPCRFLIATREWLSQHKNLPTDDITEVTEEELAKASLLKTPQQVLAHSTMFKTRATWVLSYAWPTGLALSTYSAPTIRLTHTILKPYRQPWVALHG